MTGNDYDALYELLSEAVRDDVNHKRLGDDPAWYILMAAKSISADRRNALLYGIDPQSLRVAPDAA
jgi:hypothetical protein